MQNVKRRHPNNGHWQEWRDAVERTGYTRALAYAASALLELDSATPEAVELTFSRLIQEGR